MSLSPPRARASASIPAAPPFTPWPRFHADLEARTRPGQHEVFVGPAGSGKTVAARTLARDRWFVLTLGTKPRDPEMDAYIAEGYTRIDTWPPPNRALRRNDDGSVRLVLWPKIRTREDVVRFAPVYARALDHVLAEGRWAVVADEGLWLCKKNGLDLGDHLEALAYYGRSLEITLFMVIQRPRGIPVNTWSNASHAFVWHSGVTDDQRELASLGTRNPRDVQAAIQQLRGHQFLYLPLRADGEWAISQVDLP